MFFLSGVAMVTASTYVLIYNADIILGAASRASAASSARSCRRSRGGRLPAGEPLPHGHDGGDDLASSSSP